MFIRLKLLREKNKLTQEQISKLLKISRTTYTLYELGKREIPIAHLSALAKFYNTSIDYIVEETDTKRPHRKTSF